VRYIEAGVTPIGVAFLFEVKSVYKLHGDDKPKKNKKKEKRMSMREVMELMGVRRDTYKRVRGAIRRK